MKTKLFRAILVGLLIAGAPAFAQTQLSNNQPITTSLHDREARIQTTMNSAYSAGLLSSFDLAQMQRDLDGILVRENNFKGRNDGLTDGGCKSLNKQLDVFEARVLRHSNLAAVKTAADPLQSTR